MDVLVFGFGLVMIFGGNFNYIDFLCFYGFIACFLMIFILLF